MSDKMPFKDGIYSEKSLYDVYLASKEFGSTTFNKRCLQVSFTLAIVYVAVNAIGGVDNNLIIAAIQRISSSIITVTTAILGFLIAGFSIFVSATPISILKLLALTRYEETNYSCFKQVMFNFLNVFTTYLVGMSMALLINTICPLGWAPFLKINIPLSVITTFNSTVLAMVSVANVYLILSLKSFIWSMYQSLIVNIELT